MCDWLLTSRSELWLSRQQHQSGSGCLAGGQPLDSAALTSSDDELTGYQRDLTSLRHLAHSLRAAVPRVCTHTVHCRPHTDTHTHTDLTSLRHLAHSLRAAVPRVCTHTHCTLQTTHRHTHTLRHLAHSLSTGLQSKWETQAGCSRSKLCERCKWKSVGRK